MSTAFTDSTNAKRSFALNESTTQTVSFRLPAALARQLAARGAAQNLSPGECARRIVLEALSDSANEQTREDLADLRHGLNRLREDLATATVALLVEAGNVDRAEAEAWAEQNLFRGDD